MSQSQKKKTRIFLSLPDGILSALERWAESEGNRPTTLANYLVETAVREALRAGIIPSEQGSEEPPPNPNLQGFFDLLINGELPTNGELVQLAHDWGVPTEQLLEIRDRMKPKEEQTNGT